jgi:endonuclease III
MPDGDRIIELLAAHYGPVQGDLKFLSLYQLLIAVVLSAQTTDRQVNQATPELFRRYPGFSELSRAETDDVEHIIHSTGFFRSKAHNIIALSRMIIEEFSGTVPGTREELMRLPGVGRKTANVVLSIGFGVPALAVDTHVARIAGRLGLSSSDDPHVIEQDITARINRKNWTRGHLLFITHGRTLCTARAPLCPLCPLKRLCPWKRSQTS